MSIALFVIPELLAPIQGLWRWLMPSTSTGNSLPSARQEINHEFAIQTRSANTQRHEHQTLTGASFNRPLRVVRILEADHIPSNVGRMKISGRMADVCAELDRLAARETALH
ncbi:MAG: hypothetical protein WCG50_01435 [Rhodoferax sp.]|uniref:hypothetical protein n=1 Tax=Rhodoferax sp. TaxID=50421 RepID=UPI0030183258